MLIPTQYLDGSCFLHHGQYLLGTGWRLASTQKGGGLHQPCSFPGVQFQSYLDC